MSGTMQRVKISKPTRTIHIETELGVINIYLGLHDYRGRKVETVSMLPTLNLMEGRVKVVGRRFVRLKTTRRIGQERG